MSAIKPPSDSDAGLDENGDLTIERVRQVLKSAPHFYTRRPIHLCTDDRADDDEGPPPWTNPPHPKMTRGRRAE